MDGLFVLDNRLDELPGISLGSGINVTNCNTKINSIKEKVDLGSGDGSRRGGSSFLVFFQVKRVPIID